MLIVSQKKDIEPSIGRHEAKRLHWDCKRRQSCYNSIDTIDTNIVKK